MALIKKFTPQNSDQFTGKESGDQILAKFGHLNYLLRQINSSLLNFTPGSVLFSDSNGDPAGDPTQLYWDDVNNRLGVGVNTPVTKFVVYDPSAVGMTPVSFASSAIAYFASNQNSLYSILLENKFTNISAAIGIRLANDLGLNTQIYLASSVHTSNPNRFVIDALNTTALSVQSRGGNIDLVTNGNTPSSSKLRVFLNGNVAIGTNATDAGNKFQTYGTALIQGNPATSDFTKSVLTIKNMNTAGQNTYGLITLDNNVTSLSYADIRLGTNPTGLRLYAGDLPGQPVSVGGAIQMFRNNDPNFPGQVYVDTGANNSAAIILRTSPAATGLAERMRVKANGSVRFQPMAQPATAEAGDVYYDSGTNKLRCFNGTIWNDLF